jgi:hypothetical protein
MISVSFKVKRRWLSLTSDILCQLLVLIRYSSVYALNISSITNLSTKIKTYQEDLDNNNLQIINFRPYYESALGRNLLQFENLKANLEKLIRDLVVKGKEGKIIVFADAACCLCENRSFVESEILEKWWQEVHNEWIKIITISR